MTNTTSTSKDRSIQTPVFVSPGTRIRQHPTAYSMIIVVVSVVLMSVGVANLYSASPDHSFFASQLRYALLAGLMMLVVGWLTPTRRMATLAQPAFFLSVAMLMVVLINGRIGGGAQRWLSLGPLQGQPSEFAKLAVILSVARFLSLTQMSDAYRLRDLWPLGLSVGTIFALIFLQPDLGTAGVCVIIAACQVSFLRIHRRSIGVVAIAGLAVTVVAWNVLLHDYQKLRVLTLLDPSADPTGSGYNSLQSLIAVGSGQLTGKGYLSGSQAQLQFLPARHTDFIFSVFAEEQGFWACLAVFLLFGLLVHLGLEIARQSKNTFSSLMAVGATTMIFVQLSVNFLMVLGLFPVVGIPLPFFSHGGSFLLTLGISLGCLIAVDRENCGRESLGKRPTKVLSESSATS